MNNIQFMTSTLIVNMMASLAGLDELVQKVVDKLTEEEAEKIYEIVGYNMAESVIRHAQGVDIDQQVATVISTFLRKTLEKYEQVSQDAA